MATIQAYAISNREGTTTVTFRTPRAGYFIPIFLVVGVVYLVLRWAFQHDWNGNVVAGMVGGSISFVAVTCFAMAPHLLRWEIEITPEFVTLRRKFQGIPVGGTRTYARFSVSDLGFYPNERRLGPQLGTLCVWIYGSSIELERYFPVSQGIALANDLRALGISFPRTYPEYDPSLLLFDISQDYVTF